MVNLRLIYSSVFIINVILIHFCEGKQSDEYDEISEALDLTTNLYELSTPKYYETTFKTIHEEIEIIPESKNESTRLNDDFDKPNKPRMLIELAHALKEKTDELIEIAYKSEETEKQDSRKAVELTNELNLMQELDLSKDKIADLKKLAQNLDEKIDELQNINDKSKEIIETRKSAVLLTDPHTLTNDNRTQSGVKINRIESDKNHYIVSIHHINGTQYICGGSIISSHFILSAAHCFYTRSLNPRLYYFTSGIVKYSKTDISRSIQKINIHSQYEELESGFDIALLKASMSLIYNLGLKAIPIKKRQVLSQQLVSLPVWAFDSQKYENPKELIQYAQLQILRFQTCTRYFEILDSNKQFCAMDTFGLQCKEISGGPLVFQEAQIGILSFGNGCSENTPNVFTKLSGLVGWIKRTIKMMGALQNDFPRFVN